MSAQSRTIVGGRADAVVGFLLLGLVTVGTTGVAVLELVSAPAGPLGVVIVSVAPVVLLVAVGITAFGRYRGDLAPADVLRASAWAAGLTAAFAAAGAVSIIYQLQQGGAIVHRAYYVVGWGTGGALVGILFGWYGADQRSMRRAMVEERERTEQLAQRLSVLNRVLRHDVRNGSNVILGYADLLEEEHGRSEHVSKIVREANRLCDLSDNARRVESLLDDDDAVVEQSLAAVVDEPVARLRNRYPAAEVRCDEDVDVRVTAHELADAAVWNVVQNAVLHNDSGTPSVTVETETDDDRAVVAVADDGPGIPSRERRILAVDEETQLEHSLGMGLWMSRWILQEAGGDLRVGEGNGETGGIVELEFQRA